MTPQRMKAIHCIKNTFGKSCWELGIFSSKGFSFLKILELRVCLLDKNLLIKFLNIRSFYWSLQTLTLIGQIKQPEFVGEFAFVTVNFLVGVSKSFPCADWSRFSLLHWFATIRLTNGSIGVVSCIFISFFISTVKSLVSDSMNLLDFFT